MMRILKYCWFHMVMVLTSWLPDVTPVLKLRGLLARPAFRKCGRNLQIARNVYIAFTNRLELGSDVYLAYGSWIQAGGGITMEDEVLLGPYVVLIAGDHSLQNGSYRFGPGLRQFTLGEAAGSEPTLRSSRAPPWARVPWWQLARWPPVMCLISPLSAGFRPEFSVQTRGRPEPCQMNPAAC